MRANNFPGLLASQRKIRNGEIKLPLLELCAHDLGEVGRQFHQRNWVPANTGNFSIRLDRMAMMITRSNVSKADLTKDDVVRMGLDGRSLTTVGAKPSRESPLHSMIYRRELDARSVLHTHSVSATVLSMQPGDELRCGGIEIQQALPNVDSHDDEVVLPIFSNHADYQQLADRISSELDSGIQCHNAFLIRGHGLYAWGDSIEDARRTIETWEFLMDTELLKRQLGMK